MSKELGLALIAIVAAPLSAWVGALLMQQKYRIEIGSLKADLEKKRIETRSVELENVRQGNDILMEQIVEPLESEIKFLRSDVNKFRKAIEKIPACPYSNTCPVSRELLVHEKNQV